MVLPRAFRLVVFGGQVQLFLTLANLYRDMHMYRKAAFYCRIAAMQFVSPANEQPSWLQCYNLLIRALPGYQLSLDPKEMLPSWFRFCFVNQRK